MTQAVGGQRVLIANPNLCLDRTQLVTELRPGAVMRALAVEVSAGGKGVNIARVLRAHGCRATIVGLVAERGHEQLMNLLRQEGAELVAVPIAGDVRMTVVVVERPSGRATVLNEPGPPLDAATWSHFLAAVRGTLTGRTVLACAGSLPPEAPVDAYGQLVRLAHQAGALAVVDTGPAALRASLASEPDLVAPNLQEAEAALGGTCAAVLSDADVRVRERASEAALALCDLGARAAAVTAGSAGVALAQAGPRDVRWVPAVPVDVVSAVGAGDSFVAGVLLAIDTGSAGWQEAVLRGAATAAASCEQLRVGGVDPLRVEVLLEQVRRQAAAQDLLR